MRDLARCDSHDPNRNHTRIGTVSWTILPVQDSVRDLAGLKLREGSRQSGCGPCCLKRNESCAGAMLIVSVSVQFKRKMVLLQRSSYVAQTNDKRSKPSLTHMSINPHRIKTRKIIGKTRMVAESPLCCIGFSTHAHLQDLAELAPLLLRLKQEVRHDLEAWHEHNGSDQ